jgi:hypothetical protein
VSLGDCCADIVVCFAMFLPESNNSRTLNEYAGTQGASHLRNLASLGRRIKRPHEVTCIVIVKREIITSIGV